MEAVGNVAAPHVVLFGLGEQQQSGVLVDRQAPALIESRYTDVRAANSLMLALAPYYAVGTNRVRAIFFDPPGP